MCGKKCVIIVVVIAYQNGVTFLRADAVGKLLLLTSVF